jgi:hypothetical protein
VGIFNQLGGLLQQFAAGQTPADHDVHQVFDQVSAAVPSSTMAAGLADAFRSNQTPPFAQMAAQLFSKSSGQHQSDLLNTLLSSASPAMLTQFLGNNPGSVLAGLLGNKTQVAPDQAATVPPEEVQALAEHVEKHDPSVLDRVSQVYSAHPDLIKTLGAVALGIAMKRIGNQAASQSAV